MKKIELLAPAASFDGRKAVIDAGADAVYMGGDKFGARAYADNFNKDDLIEAIRYAHLHNVKVHLTVNTILKENEINNDLYNYILPFYEAGLDAVIVQDMGVLEYINEHFPGLEKHMSTQTTITSSKCISIINKYNINRIVLARELSLEEIEEIKRETNVEVETFIHGALCYCYSGQCLLSSMIGDRSGNRGRCAQPCRKKYELYRDNDCIGNEQYLLSPKDMCGLREIHNLINIGVDSLKIEGRMKKPEYAATIVSIYRKYIDLYYKLGCGEYIKYIKSYEDEVQKDIIKMQDVYNRGGFTDGYFNKHNGREMMSVNLPSHQGVLVGKVIDVNSRKCSIYLENDVNSQDVLLIRDIDQVNPNRSYEFTIKDSYRKGNVIETNYLKGVKLQKGQVVYRVKNNSLINLINSEYIEKNKRVPISLQVIIKKDENCIVIAKLYDNAYKYEFDKPYIAENRPITKENIIKQFSKLNDTPFVLEQIDVDIDNDIFITIKILNEMRRNVIQNVIIDYNNTFLVNRVANKVDNKEVARGLNNNTNNFSKKDATLDIIVNNYKQLKSVINYITKNNYENKVCVFLEMDSFKKEALQSAISMLAMVNIDVGIALPRIIRSKDIIFIENNYKDILQNDIIVKYLIRNIEGINIAKKYIDAKVNAKEIKKDLNKKNVIVGDNNLYIANNESKKAWMKQGIDIVGISLELDKNEINMLDKSNCQMFIYGKPVVMVSAGCVKKTNNMCNNRDEILKMKDSYGEVYSVRNVCNYCYNLIYNSKAINIIDDVINENICSNYRIDFIDENEDIIQNVLEKIFGDHKMINELDNRVFKGHFLKRTL